MKATIADIRRGDRFTWGTKTYIAFDDARPDAHLTDLGDFHEIRMVQTTNLKVAEDGSFHQGTAFVDCQTVLSAKEIEISERGLRTVRLGEEPENVDTPRGWQYAENRLTGTMAARALAQRVADDIDETRDHEIRDALKAGMSVPEIMKVTGLSRARIYQIRDGRR